MQDPKAINNTARSTFSAAFLTPGAALQHAKDQVEDFLGSVPKSCAVDISSMLILENGVENPGSVHVFAMLVVARIPEGEGKL